MHNVEDDRNRPSLVIDDNKEIDKDFRKILAGDEDAADLTQAAAALFGEPVESRSRFVYACYVPDSRALPFPHGDRWSKT